MYRTNPVGVELFSYVNTSFCSNKLAWLLDASENASFARVCHMLLLVHTITNISGVTLEGGRIAMHHCTTKFPNGQDNYDDGGDYSRRLHIEHTYLSCFSFLVQRRLLPAFTS